MRSGLAVSQRARAESGDTLIEVLVAIAIMGFSFVVIVGGIGTAIISSAIQQNQATVDSALHSAVETVKGDPYAKCATTYPVTSTNPLPTGFSVSPPTVKWWNPATNQFDLAGCTSSTDSGLQLVTLVVTSTNVHAPASATLDIVKRTDL